MGLFFKNPKQLFSIHYIGLLINLQIGYKSGQHVKD